MPHTQSQTSYAKAAPAKTGSPKTDFSPITSAKLGILQKITNFLCGSLVSFFTFLIFVKLISNIWGVMLGLGINLAVSIYYIKKTKKGQGKRIVAIGVLSSVILISALSLFLWTMFLSLFNGISK